MTGCLFVLLALNLEQALRRALSLGSSAEVDALKEITT